MMCCTLASSYDCMELEIEASHLHGSRTTMKLIWQIRRRRDLKMMTAQLKPKARLHCTYTEDFSSSFPTVVLSFVSFAFRRALLKPRTMNKLVKVSSDSAPPCNQSTLDKEVPYCTFAVPFCMKIRQKVNIRHQYILKRLMPINRKQGRNYHISQLGLLGRGEAMKDEVKKSVQWKESELKHS